VSTAQRARIEQEYEAYRQDARRATPVGRSLDNLVAQASVSLDTVDPILNRLIAQDPALAEPLAAVQAHMNTARERLDLAQRASARSLLQDAARNGVNLSVYISRLTQLKATFATAQELAEMSTRYQQQVSQIEQRINELQTSLQEQLQGYRTKVSELGDYDSRYVTYAFDALEETDRTAREDLVVELIREHIAEYAEQRRVDLDLWLQTFESRFASFEG
jgi:small-conductance mechanosensitive channel